MLCAKEKKLRKTESIRAPRGKTVPVFTLHTPDSTRTAIELLLSGYFPYCFFAKEQVREKSSLCAAARPTRVENFPAQLSDDDVQTVRIGNAAKQSTHLNVPYPNFLHGIRPFEQP